MSTSAPNYIHLIPAAPLPELATGSPFKAMIVAELECSDRWRAAISTWLVESGCLYAVAWGVDCSAWDTDIDMASIDFREANDLGDAHFVMTTWHEHETLADAFWFYGNCAFDPMHDLGPGVIVHIARYPDPECVVRNYLKAQVDE